MKLAVAAVAIPRDRTAVRFWFLRRELDRRVMMTVGLTSALGGLGGAVTHMGRPESPDPKAGAQASQNRSTRTYHHRNTA
jgi:hypothetical protein